VSAWKPLPGEVEQVEAELREAIAYGQSLIAEGPPRSLDAHGLISVAEDTLDAIARGEYHSALVLAVVKMRARIESYPVKMSALKASAENQAEAAERTKRLQAHADAIRAEHPNWLKNAIAAEMVERGLGEGLSASRIRKLIR